MKTDAQLRQDILAELTLEPAADATRIGVAVKDGIVTLAGHVGSYPEQWNAERAAHRVQGVKALAVEMDVKLPGWSRRDDADIARSAECSSAGDHRAAQGRDPGRGPQRLAHPDGARSRGRTSARVRARRSPRDGHHRHQRPDHRHADALTIDHAMEFKTTTPR